MDLKDILGQGHSSGADAQGGAANKRPKTREPGGPKNAMHTLPPLRKPPKSYAQILDESIEKENPIIPPNSNPETGIHNEYLLKSPALTKEISPSSHNSHGHVVHADFTFPIKPEDSIQATPEIFTHKICVKPADSLEVSNIEKDLNVGGKDKGKINLHIQTSNPFQQKFKNICVTPDKSRQLHSHVKDSREKEDCKENLMFKDLQPDNTSKNSKVFFQEPRRGSQVHTTFLDVVRLETKSIQNTIDLATFNSVLEFLLLPEVHKLIANPQTKLYLNHRAEMIADKSSTASKNSSLFNTKSHSIEGEGDNLKHSNSKRVVDATRKRHSSKTKSKIFPKQDQENGTSIESNEVSFRHTIEYLPLAVFLASQQKNPHWDPILVDLYRKQHISHKSFESETMYEDEVYLVTLINKMINLDEYIFFQLLIDTFPKLNSLITHTVLEEIIVTNGKYDYPRMYYRAYHKRVSREKISKEDHKAILNNDVTNDSREVVLFGPQLSRSKVILLCKNYFKHSSDNTLILDILRLLGITKNNLVDLLMEIRDEDRIISILMKQTDLLDYISVDDLIHYHTYGPLVLFDSMELINIFNMPVSKSKQTTLYQKLCEMIGNGEQVESLCHIINHVSSTFWDMQKLRRFFESLQKTLSGKNSNWLVYIQNPLLFCMTLVYFFKKLRAQLDYNDKDIIRLPQDMLTFCQIYIENASQEALNINLFDKDNYGNGFLDYAFLVKEMSILETGQIEGLLYEMWDLNRHTLQTVTEFMRVSNMKEKLNRFSLDFFCNDYSMPIEDGDTFQLEFSFASNSVQLKVYSELLWPITVIIIELYFSLWVVDRRLNSEFGHNWLSRYRTSLPIISILHLIIRGSYTLSILIKTLAIKAMISETHYMQSCFNFCLLITFFQTVIYPVFFPGDFWALNITQLLYVLSIVVYVLQNALALNNVGVLLQIFFRMALVVLVFGTVSFTYITAIAYTIHVVFSEFGQRAEGQIYTDYNLFDNLYQGIMTLFEFVFGAVILVRPYLEDNIYTYTMTFVMTIFSFFGNIMMANMLVAFLTSQFDLINKNAKYLTMSKQYGLIRIFGRTDMDTLISMPYILAIPSLPIYALFLIGGNTKRRANLILRKLIHIWNVFLPTCLFISAKLLLLIPLRYLMQLLVLFFRIPFNKLGVVHWLAWILLSPLLMCKLLYLDVTTMCTIILNFSGDGKQLLDFDLKVETRNNLVGAFSRLSKTVVSFYNRSIQYVTVKEFMDNMKALSMQELLVKHVSNKVGNNRHSIQQEASMDVSDPPINLSAILAKKNFNSKYLHDQKILAPVLLQKYADYTSRNPTPEEMKINIRFMNDKLRNNINPENIGRLIAFEKYTLDKASMAFHDEDPSHEVELEFHRVNSRLDETGERMKQVLDGILKVKAHLKC